MSKDFTSNIASSIKHQGQTVESNNKVISQDKKSISDIHTKEQFEKPTLKIGRKKDIKISKKSFPLYLDEDRNAKLDKLCKRTGYSKNELIIKMIDFGFENLETE